MPVFNMSQVIHDAPGHEANGTHGNHTEGFEKRQKEALTDEENDLEWAGTISIGTPAQSFLIDFDSTYYDLGLVEL